MDLSATCYVLDPALPPESSAIVIVGGGFSGAVLAYHLLRQPGMPLHVTLIERDGELGHGIAYAARDAALRLNVPAARMSVDPSEPDGFVRFARAAGVLAADPHAFLPRALYGRYVASSLQAASVENAGRLRVVRGEAVAIDARGVSLADGRVIAGSRVVLATGLAKSRACFDAPNDPRIIDAWDEAGCRRAADGSGRTLLVGAGLSALDVLTLFDATNKRHQLTVVSRHGLLPRAHAAVSGKFDLPLRFLPPPRELRALLRWGRAVVATAAESGADWQHALDALRPLLPALWQGLSPYDRRRFVRRIRPYWEVLRHRAPRDVLEKLEARRARGELRVLAGRVLHCRALPEALEITLRLAGGAEVVERFGHVVRCLGPALEVGAESSPLLASLFAAGLATRDAAAIGIATGECGRLIDALGQPSDRLFALGQLCRAARWETTSAPEIVRDALALSQLLARRETFALPVVSQ